MSVGRALSLAAANLQEAQNRLEVVKAQYHSAEATYENAKNIYEALKSLPVHYAQSADHESQLCESCKSVPISTIFKQASAPGKVNRRKVGDLFHAVEHQTSCTFCRFLIEAFQIGSEDQPERLHAQLKPRDTAIFFAREPDGKAWHTKAGVATSVPSCPFFWLQTGQPTVTGEPHICITFEPAVEGNSDVTRSSKIIYPRRRDALEAFNGSMNYDLVTSWLEQCRADHSPECRHNDRLAPTLPLDIYLIDVQSNCFVRRSAGERFVALSYVWGDITQTPRSISISPKRELTVAKGNDPAPLSVVQKLPSSLPQTMIDAMTFVQRIGERFLWIDQLCIDQRNSQEKQRQINMMDQIFESSYLTLVNLDGMDADWGLPGISRPLLRTQQPTVNLKCGRLMATYVYSNWDNNGTSMWDSRGWTLQERLLSQRCIMFAKSYISMTCRTEFFHDCLAINEEAVGSRTWLGNDFFREDGTGINLDDTEWDFKNYDALVSVFSARNLTYDNDILNACRGSLNRLSRNTSVEFCLGLPVETCLRALIWMPHSKHVIIRRPGFPSWSWIGWKGRIEYAYWVGDMAAYLDEELDTEIYEQGPSTKRRRTTVTEITTSHPARAKILTHPHEPHGTTLELETTVVKYKLRLVRRNGETCRTLKSGSQQSRMAIGDHWTLLDDDGHAMRDSAGEYPYFELTDFFFRVKAEYSEILMQQNNEADFMFVEHWPRIRDSALSNKWLFDMVSALLIIRNGDGTSWRLASLLLRGKDWYMRSPRLENVSLI